VELPPIDRRGQNFRYALNHRTNTGPRIRQTATRFSDESRFRRLVGSFTVLEARECLRYRLKDEGKGRPRCER